jgi:hypothetical protein
MTHRCKTLPCIVRFMCVSVDFFSQFSTLKVHTPLGMIIMDSNLAGTFDDSFITDSNYLKWKLVIFMEQFS